MVKSNVLNHSATRLPLSAELYFERESWSIMKDLPFNDTGSFLGQSLGHDLGSSQCQLDGLVLRGSALSVCSQSDDDFFVDWQTVKI